LKKAKQMLILIII